MNFIELKECISDIQFSFNREHSTVVLNIDFQPFCVGLKQLLRDKGLDISNSGVENIKKIFHSVIGKRYTYMDNYLMKYPIKEDISLNLIRCAFEDADNKIISAGGLSYKNEIIRSLVGYLSETIFKGV